MLTDAIIRDNKLVLFDSKNETDEKILDIVEQYNPVYHNGKRKIHRFDNLDVFSPDNINYNDVVIVQNEVFIKDIERYFKSISPEVNNPYLVNEFNPLNENVNSDLFFNNSSKFKVIDLNRGSNEVAGELMKLENQQSSSGFFFPEGAYHVTCIAKNKFSYMIGREIYMYDTSNGFRRSHGITQLSTVGRKFIAYAVNEFIYNHDDFTLRTSSDRELTFDSKIVDFSSNNLELIVLLDNGKIFSFRIGSLYETDVIETDFTMLGKGSTVSMVGTVLSIFDSSTKIMHSKFKGEEYFHSEDIIGENAIMLTVGSMFSVNGNTQIKHSIYRESFKELSDASLASEGSCPQIYRVIDGYESNATKSIQTPIVNRSSFVHYENKVYSISKGLDEQLRIYDTGEYGLFGNQLMLVKSISLGQGFHNFSGMAYYDGYILVCTTDSKTIKKINIEDYSVSSVDLSSLLPDIGILDISFVHNEIYILSTNGTVTVLLDMEFLLRTFSLGNYTVDTKMVTLGSYSILCSALKTGDNNIYSVSSATGVISSDVYIAASDKSYLSVSGSSLFVLNMTNGTMSSYTESDKISRIK